MRSRIMSAIRGADTTPERAVRSALHQAGFRFRLHNRSLAGSPDIVLQRYRTVVFVHGCFWHKHDCGRFRWPKTRAAFWRAKISANVDRDRRTAVFLRSAGWRVEVIWECQVQGRELASIIGTLRRRKQAMTDAEQRQTPKPAVRTA